MKPAISLITLGVDNMTRSRAFYQALGWKLSKASNPHVSFFHMHGTQLALWSRVSLLEDAGLPAGERGSVNFTLAMSCTSKNEVDERLQEAKASGATILKAAHDTFWGGYSGYFADTEGHVWEVAWNPYFPLQADGTIKLP